MEGYQVVEAANLDEAIRRLEQNVVDVVVTALDLPPYTSADVRDVLRRRPEWRGIPILLLADSAEQAAAETLAERTDIERPRMDGLETLRHIRREYPRLRVIMFSTLTERGAAVTLEALTLGADDYVAKASNEGSLDRSMARLREELIPKIKQFFRLPEQPVRRAAATAAAAPVGHGGPVSRHKPVAQSDKVRPRVVAIGVSTCGPNALGAILPEFPAGFPLPVLLVQHMPPLFTCARLSKIPADRSVTIAVRTISLTEPRQLRKVGRGLSRHRRPAIFLHQFDQRGRANRFGNIIVHAGGQATLPVPGHGMRRHRNDGNVRPTRMLVLPDVPGCLEPAHLRHL